MKATQTDSRRHMDNVYNMCGWATPMSGGQHTWGQGVQGGTESALVSPGVLLHVGADEPVSALEELAELLRPR